MKITEGRLRVAASDVANFLACQQLTQLDLQATRGALRPRLRLSASDVANFLACEHLTRLDLLGRGGHSAPARGRHRVPGPGAARGGARARGARAVPGGRARGSRSRRSGGRSRDDRSGDPERGRGHLPGDADGGRGRSGAAGAAGLPGAGGPAADAGRGAAARTGGTTRWWTPSWPGRRRPGPSLQTAFYSRSAGRAAGRPSRAGCTWRSAHGEFGVVQGRRLRRLRTADPAAAGRDFVAETGRDPPGPVPRAGRALRHLPVEASCARAGGGDDDDLSLIAGMTEGAAASAEGGRDRDPARVRRPRPSSRPGPGEPGVPAARPGAGPAAGGQRGRRGPSGTSCWSRNGTPAARWCPNRGLLALPEPVDGDLFFDIEGARYYSEDGREFGLQYLFGIVDTADIDEAGTPAVHARSGRSTGAGEKRAFEELIDFITERRAPPPRVARVPLQPLRADLDRPSHRAARARGRRQWAG